MKTLLQEPIEENSKLLIKGGRGKINEAGKITDEKTEMEIRRVLSNLISKIERRSAYLTQVSHKATKLTKLFCDTL